MVTDTSKKDLETCMFRVIDLTLLRKSLNVSSKEMSFEGATFIIVVSKFLMVKNCLKLSFHTIKQVAMTKSTLLHRSLRAKPRG